MGMFSGIKDAKANFGSNYEREGQYLMMIRRVKLGQNRGKEWFVAVEKVCLDMIDPGKEPKPHTVGEQCSHLLCDYGPSKDSFLPNYKAMIMGVMGVTETDVDEETCDLITSDEQPLAGMIVQMQNHNIVTKKGTDFTKIRYVRGLSFTEAAEKIDSAVLEKHLTKEEMDFFLENLALENEDDQ